MSRSLRGLEIQRRRGTTTKGGRIPNKRRCNAIRHPHGWSINLWNRAALHMASFSRLQIPVDPPSATLGGGKYLRGHGYLRISLESPNNSPPTHAHSRVRLQCISIILNVTPNFGSIERLRFAAVPQNSLRNPPAGAPEGGGLRNSDENPSSLLSPSLPRYLRVSRSSV